MADNRFDLVVIGGGPGGYVAAVRAAQLGMRTALVERQHLGGICLNWGCIPTKAMLRSGHVYRNMKHAEAYGLSAPHASFDLAEIVARSRGISAQLQAGVKHLLKKNNVTVVEGHGELRGGGKVVVESANRLVLSAPHIILASGARARGLPGGEPDGEFIWTYKEALVAESAPRKLLVIGSGAIGIEFASFFNVLGAQVTIVETMERVLPTEDEEISRLARQSLERQGMTILLGATVNGVTKSVAGVTAAVEVGGKTREIVADRALLAVGIAGNVENVGLENTKAKVEKTHVQVNEWCETGEPGLYAIGDVAGPPWLAHKASREGVMVVEKIKGLAGVRPIDVRKIPGCTYCHPQIASVGLSEAKAKATGRRIRVGRFPFVGNGKAIALGETEGMIKTVFDGETGELLGAHMIGGEVTEMIQGYVVAMTLETTEAELIHTVFPHPTLGEAMHEAVLDAYGRTIHF